MVGEKSYIDSQFSFLSFSLSYSLSPSFFFVLFKRAYTYISINRQMLYFRTRDISRERKLRVRKNFIQTIGKLITRPLQVCISFRSFNSYAAVPLEWKRLVLQVGEYMRS